MANNINISNLQLFNKEEGKLTVTNDLQKQLQEGIANKVAKLLNAEEFINTFIPNSLGSQIKLHICLTKDDITVRVLEESPKAEAKNIQQEDLSDNIKKRKEKIIKKVNTLFKGSASCNGSTPLQAKNTPSLPRKPSISSKENIPFKVGFDADILSPQLDIKSKELQHQINRQDAFSEQIQDIKEQIKLIEQAVHTLANNTQNTPNPRFEEASLKYSFINRLIDNQHTIYLELLKILSKNLHQISHPDAENSYLKDIAAKLEAEKDVINDKLKSLSQNYEEVSKLLEQKEQTILVLQQNLEDIANLQSQLSTLKEEKNTFESKIGQLQQDAQIQAKSSLDSSNTIKALENELANKQGEVNKLDAHIKNLSTDHQNLQEQKASLEKSHTLAKQNYEEVSKLLEQKEQAILVLQQNLEDIANLQSQLSTLKEEKSTLELKFWALNHQITEDQNKSSAGFTSKIEELQAQIKEQTRLQDQISTLQKEKEDLASEWKRTALSIKESLLLESEKSKALFYEDHLEQLDQKKEKIAELQEKVMDLNLQQNNLQNQLSLTKESQAELQQLLAAKEELISQLQKEKALLEETNSRINSTLEKDLLADQHIATMLEQVNILPRYPEEIPSIPLENSLPIFQTNDISPSRRYNPKFYALHNISDDSFSEDDFSDDSSIASNMSAKQIEKLQSTLTMLQKEIENTATSNPIEEIEKMKHKIELLSLELSKKNHAITNSENTTVELLCNRITQLEEKIAIMKKMESKLENTQREKEDLFDDNQGLEKRIHSLDEKVKTERRSKVTLEDDLVNQLQELRDENRAEIETIKEFYSLIFQEVFIEKKLARTSDLDPLFKTLEKTSPALVLEIIRTLDPSYLEKENSLLFIESENNNANITEDFGESLVANAKIQRPKPPGKWQKRNRSSSSKLNTI